MRVGRELRDFVRYQDSFLPNGSRARVLVLQVGRRGPSHADRIEGDWGHLALCQNKERVSSALQYEDDCLTASKR